MQNLFPEALNGVAMFSSKAAPLTYIGVNPGVITFWHQFVTGRTAADEYILGDGNNRVQLIWKANGDLFSRWLSPSGSAWSGTVTAATLTGLGFTTALLNGPCLFVCAYNSVAINGVFVLALSGSGGNGTSNATFGGTNTGSYLAQITGWSGNFVVNYYDRMAVLYNGGRGIRDLRYLRWYSGLCTHNHDLGKLSFGRFVPLMGNVALAPLRGLPYKMYQLFSKILGQSTSARFANAVDYTPLPTAISQYIYEQAQLLLDASGKTGIIIQQDNVTTDLPESWANQSLVLNSGSLSGSSVITKSKLQNFYMQYMAAPAGNALHSLTFGGIDNDMTDFNVNSGRLNFISLAPSAGKVVVITNLTLQSNSLSQTFAQLYDVAKVKVVNFNGVSAGALTGSIAFSDNATSFSLANTGTAGITGTVPALPATLTGTLNITNNGLQTPPATWGTASFVDLRSNQFNGAHALQAQSTFQVGGNSGISANQGSTGTGNTVDMRGLTVNMVNCYLDNCRLTLVQLPTTAARTIKTFTCYRNPGLVPLDFTGCPVGLFFSGTSAGYSGDFIAYTLPNMASVVWPLGTIIKSAAIHIYDNSADLATVNANIDAWLDNQAGWSVATWAKAFYLHTPGTATNNAIADNTGRATRLSDLLTAVRNNNWLVMLAHSTYSTTTALAKNFATVAAFIAAPAANQTDRIVAQLSAIPSGLPATVEITNTTNFNGTWTVVGRYLDAACTQANYFVSAYYLLQKTGFGVPNFATEKGVLISS